MQPRFRHNQSDALQLILSRRQPHQVDFDPVVGVSKEIPHSDYFRPLDARMAIAELVRHLRQRLSDDLEQALERKLQEAIFLNCSTSLRYHRCNLATCFGDVL